MWDLVEEINTEFKTRLSYNIDIKNDKIEYTKSQTTVFKRQTQLHSDFSQLVVLDLRYGL